MKKNKILICVNSQEEVKYYHDLGISNFLFPIKNFSIGYGEFTLEEISKYKDTNNYLLVNRLLTDTDIDEFLKLDIPDNVKGLVVEDIGLYYALKDSKFEIINFQNHLNNSYKTVNYWLKYFDSLVLSTDITLEEIETILNNATKPLIVNTFGYPMIMYSRRKLLSNFFEHLGENSKSELKIDIPNQVKFKLAEQEYGTAVFDDHLLDIRKSLDSLDESKIKYYLFNTKFISKEIMTKALNDEFVEDTTEGFLHTKTIYRVGDIK